MLSRFARPAFVRRAIRCAPRCAPRSFSTQQEARIPVVIPVDATAVDPTGKTEEELKAELQRAMPGMDFDTHHVWPIVEPGGPLDIVDGYGLIDKIAAMNLETAAEQQAGLAPEVGLLHAIGLGPFHRKASLLVTGAITAVANEVYVLNEETYVAACIIAAFTTMFVLAREPALAAFKSYQEEMLKVHNDAENRHIASCKNLIKAQSGTPDFLAAIKHVFVEKEHLVHTEALARAIDEKNKVAKHFDAKLQALVNRKANEETKAYKSLVDSVYADVLQTVASDEKFKQSALKYALAAISTPEKAGINPTVTLFETILTKK